jgi:hypothetical protein
MSNKKVTGIKDVIGEGNTNSKYQYQKRQNQGYNNQKDKQQQGHNYNNNKRDYKFNNNSNSRYNSSQSQEIGGLQMPAFKEREGAKVHLEENKFVYTTSNSNPDQFKSKATNSQPNKYSDKKEELKSVPMRTYTNSVPTSQAEEVVGGPPVFKGKVNAEIKLEAPRELRAQEIRRLEQEKERQKELEIERANQKQISTDDISIPVFINSKKTESNDVVLHQAIEDKKDVST